MDHLKLRGDYTSLFRRGKFCLFFEATQSNLLNLSHTLILQYTGRPIILNTTGRLHLIAIMDICTEVFLLICSETHGIAALTSLFFDTPGENQCLT